MSNPLSRAAVGRALGIAPDHQTADIFKRLVASSFLPAPLDTTYDNFDLTAIQGKVATAAQIVAAAAKIAAEHRGGPAAVF